MYAYQCSFNSIRNIGREQCGYLLTEMQIRSRNVCRQAFRDSVEASAPGPLAIQVVTLPS